MLAQAVEAVDRLLGLVETKLAARSCRTPTSLPTCVQLAGSSRVGIVAGHSLLPLLHPTAGGAVAWPTVALIEHHGPSDVHDPDFEKR